MRRSSETSVRGQPTPDHRPNPSKFRCKQGKLPSKSADGPGSTGILPSISMAYRSVRRSRQQNLQRNYRGILRTAQTQIRGTSLPESREKNRLEPQNRRSHHQQRAVNQPFTKHALGAVSEGSEGGRSASEGASREGKPRHDSSPNVDYRIIYTRSPAPPTPVKAGKQGE